jgi:hypothetical protein
MAVGKATALVAAIFGVVMFAGVRRDVSPRTAPTPSLATAELLKRLEPFLTDGIRGNIVAGEFQTAEDFAATVHASRNLRVPFMALKQQVVGEGKPLAAAIQAVKPTANASLEADLARSEARADLATVK